ncbi:MAG: hypothetical protein ACJA13_000268 [Paraglaciecola sp.]|jgi:hypothetical protein
MGLEKTYLNKKYYYLPSNNNESNGLIILMSTHNQKDKYFLFKKMKEFQNRTSDVIFVTDPNNSYYLENDGGESYFHFFKFIIKKYINTEISFFGTSMSGYGALFFSGKLGCNSIVNNPQLDLKKSYEYAWPNLKETLSRINNLELNIPLILKDCSDIQSCFVVSGEHPMDKMNRKILDEMSSFFRMYLSQNINDKSHGFYLSDIVDIFRIHNAILSLNEINLIKIEKLKY